MSTIRILSMALLSAVFLPPSPSPAEERKDPALDGIWIDVYQGEPIRYEELLKDLAMANVIYLGECHTTPLTEKRFVLS